MLTKSGLTIGIVILIAQIWLLVSADALFPGMEIWKIMMVYLVMQALVIASLDLTIPTLSTGVLGLTHFFIGFGITALIVMLIPQGLTGSLEVLSIDWTLGVTIVMFTVGILYAFIKAFVEETVFRFALERKAGLTRLTVAVLFGLFHGAVLSIGGAAITSILFGMFFLAVLGYVWSLFYDHFGILGATGSHLAWNISALGLLGMLIGAG